MSRSAIFAGVGCPSRKNVLWDGSARGTDDLGSGNWMSRSQFLSPPRPLPLSPSSFPPALQLTTFFLSPSSFPPAPLFVGLLQCLHACCAEGRRHGIHFWPALKWQLFTTAAIDIAATRNSSSAPAIWCFYPLKVFKAGLLIISSESTRRQACPCLHSRCCYGIEPWPWQAERGQRKFPGSDASACFPNSKDLVHKISKFAGKSSWLI